jgi:hypothetical protein
MKEFGSFVVCISLHSLRLECQKCDSLVAADLELHKDDVENNNEATDNTSICLATTCSNNDYVTLTQETNKLIIDDKISEEQLRAQMCRKYRLSTEQQEDLYNVLAKC